jgi:hypothetical protein
MCLIYASCFWPQAGYSPRILAAQTGSRECLVLLGLSYEQSKLAESSMFAFTQPPTSWSLRHTWAKPSLSSEYAMVGECECSRWALFELVRSVNVENLCTPSLALYAMLAVRLCSIAN